jgi:hypothetical protein
VKRRFYFFCYVGGRVMYGEAPSWITSREQLDRIWRTSLKADCRG